MSKTRHQNFVIFFSPGTFVAETSQRPIKTWDCGKAVQMANEITERYDAKPYAFQFLEMMVADKIDDGEGGKLEVRPREIKRSANHFIGGEILSLDDIRNRADPKESILLSNMECNEFAYVVENRNSWKAVLPFGKDDVVVDKESGAITERGDAKERLKYRAEKHKEYEERIAAIS